MEEDERHGNPEHEPVLIEGQQHDEDEEREVGLDRAAGDMHHQGGGRHQAARAEQAAQLASEPGDAGENREEQEHGDVSRVVHDAVPREERAVDRNPDDQQPQQDEHRLVPAMPFLLGKGASGGQLPTDGARESRRGHARCDRR